MATGSDEDDPLPPDIEHRLAEFTELVGTAIANTQAREELRQLAEEQAALRRVATLIAGEATPQEVFAAVAREVAGVLCVRAASVIRYIPGGRGIQEGLCGEGVPVAVGESFPLERHSASGLVWRTGRTAAVDLPEAEGQIPAKLTAVGLRSAVAVPVVVDGTLWGCVLVLADDRSSFPDAIQDRLGSFTELVATAIANTQARDDLRGLVDEQSGLRRVATLVAQGAPPAEVFAAVAAEVSVVLDLPLVEMCRYESDGTATVVGAIGDHPFQTGTTWTLDGPSLTAQVKETGRPARVDDYAHVPGSIGEAARATGVHAGVGAPIIVDGKVWGVVSAGGDARVPLRPDAEGRLSQFTELVATAISNAQAREDLRAMAEEQAALRRVATLVARGAAPADIFALVAQEIARVTGLEMVMIGRYDLDRTVTLTGAVGEHPFQPGTRWSLDGTRVSSQILDTGRSVRSGPYQKMTGTIAEAARSAGTRAGVGAPVIVDGQVWGNVTVAGTERVPLPPGIERRLTQFTELIATAVSNAQARQDLRRFVDEQAALRRIATLVAQGAESQLVFDAVCEETGRLFSASTVNLAHFTADGFNLTIAGWSVRDVHVPTATRVPLDGDTINSLVQRTAAPVGCDSYEHAEGELAALLRRLGIRSEVGAPVIVDGKVWGVLIAGTDQPEPLAPGTEHRLGSFAELIATAVSNTTARSDLIASRARIVAAGDEQRRRVVRDLHDGAQQRLVHAVISLQLAHGADDLRPELARLVADALDDTRGAIEELRELSHGLHPALLTTRGLAAAVEELADRASVPVRVEVPDQRYAAAIESAAYFIAAEALTNVAKYANASTACLTVAPSGDALVLVIEDDGVGGATARPGSGLSGLLDRVAALDGTLSVESPPGAGTRIRAELPLTTPTRRDSDGLPGLGMSDRATAPILVPD